MGGFPAHLSFLGVCVSRVIVQGAVCSVACSAGSLCAQKPSLQWSFMDLILGSVSLVCKGDFKCLRVIQTTRRNNFLPWALMSTCSNFSSGGERAFPILYSLVVGKQTAGTQEIRDGNLNLFICIYFLFVYIWVHLKNLMALFRKIAIIEVPVL